MSAILDVLDTEETIEKVARALHEKFTPRVEQGDDAWSWYEVAKEAVSAAASLHINLSIAKSRRRTVILACLMTLKESLNDQRQMGQNFVVARSMEHGNVAGVRQDEVEEILGATMWDLFKSEEV